MKRVLVLCSLAFIAFALPTAASASTISDPIIGVRGTRIGSFPSNDSTFFDMAGCPGDLTGAFSTVFCATYDIVNPVIETPETGVLDSSYYPPSTLDIFSLTFRFANADGGIPNTAIFPDSGEGSSGLNEFGTLMRSETDPFAVTLALTGDALSCAINPSYSESHESCFQVYLAVPVGETVSSFYQVSLTAINGMPQDATLAPVPKGVPEPATLLLMGTGLTALAGRRLRRKKTN